MMRVILRKIENMYFKLIWNLWEDKWFEMKNDRNKPSWLRFLLLLPVFYLLMVFMPWSSEENIFQIIVGQVIVFIFSVSFLTFVFANDKLSKHQDTQSEAGPAPREENVALSHKFFVIRMWAGITALIFFAISQFI